MTARERLNEKMSAEYKAFTEGLKSKTPDEIIEAAYETVYKADIIACVGDESKVGERELAVLLRLENPLTEVYREWLRSDYTHMDDLSNIINDFAAQANDKDYSAQVINGSVATGDYVIVAPEDDYGHLVGEVIYIDRLGTPEHETGNPGDDVHVNFRAFDYPPWQRVGIEEHFAELTGGEHRNFDGLPLDDVIIAPDALISLSGVSAERIQELVANFDEAEYFCAEVMRRYPADREAASAEGRAPIDAEHEEIVNRIASMEYGMNDAEFERRIKELLPGVTSDALNFSMDYSADLEADGVHPNEKTLAEYYVEFGLIKHQFGEGLTTRLFNLAEDCNVDVMDLRRAARLLLNGTGPHEIGNMIANSPPQINIEDDNEFGRALIAFAESRARQSVYHSPESPAEGKASTDGLEARGGEILSQRGQSPFDKALSRGKEKSEAYKVQKAQEPDADKKNRGERS